MKPEIGRWKIETRRAQEAPRWGLGRDSLRLTLKHLKDRGDTAATLVIGDAPAQRVKLTLALGTIVERIVVGG